MMRLRPGLAVLWRRPGECQIGVDPRCAVVLEGLTEAEHRFVDRLHADRSETDVLRVARAAGVSTPRAHELLDLLGRSGVLDRAAPRVREELTPEEAYWARLRPDAAGDAIVARRRAATVAVLGLDRLGMTLATFLATAGVGTLLLTDEASVLPADLGPYHPRDLGVPRQRRAREQLSSAFPHVATTARPGTRVDVAVAVFHGVADPVRLRPLAQEDVVHLPVVVREVDVSIGPLVTPGVGPCSRCLDLHRTDADPAWPALATQLRVQPAPGTDAAVAHLGAALAAHQVLAAVDGRATALVSATLEVDALDPLPVLRRWSVHPECGCGGLPVPDRPGGGAAPARKSSDGGRTAGNEATGAGARTTGGSGAGAGTATPVAAAPKDG
ncbi:ThiF family adenylyltransferase [Georgenia sp. TF02-10]|uniref:ThiF family adenylyltransferase n=1 Tax=Georgenia sp. TF02-10 TaxID=2917725 RepID=UPI001FA7D493|nr:ThiF family adenylyltransferase [Georgenia sp. TF02-10]UNX53944.1 ThiF family adenylyltransferase [Georgenia sp. TF02-10]